MLLVYSVSSRRALNNTEGSRRGQRMSGDIPPLHSPNTPSWRGA